MKILNLYAGIGGNRKLWGDEHEVTAVEINKSIAKIYKDFFPNDKVIVGDAHQYLLKHYKEFDFIWSSPPCPTHSRLVTLLKNKKTYNIKYPDMKLYQEILLLKHFFKGKWIVENVITYYDPLIKPQIDGRHYYWANFIITNKTQDVIVRNNKGFAKLNNKMQAREIIVKDFHNYKGDKRQLLNNCVDSKAGFHIFNCAFKEKQKTLGEK
jgi:DNA (cytosine-5)-methyltransferase 1